MLMKCSAHRTFYRRKFPDGDFLYDAVSRHLVDDGKTGPRIRSRMRGIAKSAQKPVKGPNYGLLGSGVG